MIERVKRRRWWFGGLVLTALALLAFIPAWRSAWERNVLALQVKPLVKNISWVDASRVCMPLDPPPAVTGRQCSAAENCYISAVLAMRRGQWDNIQTSSPSDPDPLHVFLRGWGVYCARTAEQAIAAWSAAAAPIGSKFLAEAEASLRDGDADLALRQGKFAHALQPSSRSFLVLAGAQEALDDDSAALETYYRAIEQDMATARTFGQVGELEWRLEINRAARTHLENAVRLDPLNWHYWQIYGSVLMRLEEWESSETAFSHAAELSPEFGAAHGGVALMQLRLGKLQQGRQAVEATLRFTTNVRQQAGYLGEFARLAADAGDLRWSAELYTRALGRAPTIESWWNALIATYARLGDCSKMESVYRAYGEHMTAQAKQPAPQPACPTESNP